LLKSDKSVKLLILYRYGHAVSGLRILRFSVLLASFFSFYFSVFSARRLNNLNHQNNSKTMNHLAPDLLSEARIIRSANRFASDQLNYFKHQ